jgi:predicted dehydrogenase
MEGSGMAGAKISRREFLGGSLAAAALTIVPRYVLGGPGRTPPSDVVTRATIGLGRGHGFTLVNKEGEPVRQLAVCDVDGQRLARSLKKAGRGCEGYGDFRRIMDRDDIDVVYVMTPPHWHALISIAAAQTGKDVYCEKPMTRFIAEGRAVADAMRRYGRVFQVGTFGRFGSGKLKKLVSSGLLGSPLTARITRANGYNWKVREWSGRINQPPEPVPEHLGWDMYVGPAPMKPYFRHRTHGSFRGYWDYDGGGLADMGQHYLDGIQYALGKDDTSPVEIEAHAPYPAHPDAVGMWGRVTLTYADGDRIILESGEWGEPEPGGPFAWIEGPKGKVYRNNRTDPPGLFDQAASLPDPPEMHGRGPGGFERAVKERKECGGNPAVAHRCACLMHLANIAIRTGRKLRYDPVREQFVGDEEANRLANVPMRAPWHL